MKEQQYQMLVSQIASLIEGETDEIAVMSNVAAAIHQEMRFWWTGFYRVAGDELLLGPFQGPVACMHIPFGKGVCGTAWQRRETSSSQVILPAAVRRVPKSSCRCLIKKVISLPCSISTVNTWQPSTTSIATIWSRSAS